MAQDIIEPKSNETHSVFGDVTNSNLTQPNLWGVIFCMRRKSYKVNDLVHCLR